MGNIIKAILCKTRVCRTAPLYQYDYGQILQIVGPQLPSAYEVHFSNQPHGTATTQIGGDDGVVIPDAYLQTGSPVYAWLFLHTGENDGETEYSITIPVIARARPTNETPTPVQQDAITEAIAALNSGVERAEAAADGIEQTVNDALAAAKASGEFDGKDGTRTAPPGASAYVWIRYAATEPTQDSDMKTTPDAWMGIYSGDSATAPTAYTDYTWYNIKGQTGPVTDVQVNGTSILNNGVANVPRANDSAFGTVKVEQYHGIYVDADGFIVLYNPPDAALKLGNNFKYAVNTFVQHKATFYGLAKAAGDTTQSQSRNAVGTYTESAKSTISQMLNGAVSVSGSTPAITALPGIQYICGEVSTLDITLPASGIVDVVFESGSTPTVLTITPQTGMTVEWANGFDSTALEADTLYELNIKMVGTKCLGVAASWT